MILVDTSVWVDHFRRTNNVLATLLRDAAVLCHPFIIGELACGRLGKRDEILALLAALPQVGVTDHDDVMTFIETNRLMGLGIGWIDVHLLSSAMQASTPMWTMDKRLAAAASSLDLCARP